MCCLSGRVNVIGTRNHSQTITPSTLYYVCFSNTLNHGDTVHTAASEEDPLLEVYLCSFQQSTQVLSEA
jgi:hypothetical protein